MKPFDEAALTLRAALAAAAQDPVLARRRALWQDYEAEAERLTGRFAGLYAVRSFDHVQPVALQREVPSRLRKPYPVRVAYTDWGPPDAPLLVCVGGVANAAMRFAFLAADLARTHRIVCMDWLGRGRSGWLADEREYRRATYVEQLRQLVDHLGDEATRRPFALLGSSMGGTVAIEYAARHPKRVGRLVLNDVGPFIPRSRRRRRADALARHYVFAAPEDLARRTGAAQKHDGPVGEDVRRFIAYHLTRWSDADGGRIYRHDPRAMQAYRDEAATSLSQWPAWACLRCPVLVLHGMASDALSARTIARMRREGPPLAVAHVPDTGHTPVLADRHQTAAIGDWLLGDGGPAEFSVPHAGPRVLWTLRQEEDRSQGLPPARDERAR